MPTLAVFCGAAHGVDPCYRQAVAEFADAMYEYQCDAVYGAGHVGLMGVLANRLRQHDVRVVGVTTRALSLTEGVYSDLSACHIVETLAERKKLMVEFADGCVLLPGGAGSLDEFFEMFTLNQLAVISKPCAILNVNQYYQPLLNCLDHAVAEGFLLASDRQQLMVEESPKQLLQKFAARCLLQPN